MLTPNQVEITVSVSGKIPRRQYENFSPMYSVKEIINDGRLITDEDRLERQRVIRLQLEEMFNKDREKIQLDELQSIYKNLDFITNPKNGKRYPRVSDIIYWDTEFYINPDELSQYGARGTGIHACVDNWLNKKEWGPFDKVISKRDMILLKTGTLKLWETLDQFNFIGFMDEFGKDIELEEGEFRAFNDDFFYCGQPDRVGKYKGKKAIFDYKCRGINDADFKQMAAYCHLDDPRLKGIEVMVGIPLNPKNKSGYGKPVVETEIDKYFNQFLRDREEFKEKFKI